TSNSGLAGGHDLIVTRAGELIADSRLAKQQAATLTGKRNVHLMLKDLKLVEAQDILVALASAPHGTVVVESKDHDNYFAMTELQGPGWIFVSVYPKHLITDAALGNARIVLILGILALLLEMLVLGFILQSHIGRPLMHFADTTDRFASG